MSGDAGATLNNRPPLCERKFLPTLALLGSSGRPELTRSRFIERTLD
jgi:hypothetical protein